MLQAQDFKKCRLSDLKVMTNTWYEQSARQCCAVLCFISTDDHHRQRSVLHIHNSYRRMHATDCPRGPAQTTSTPSAILPPTNQIPLQLIHISCSLTKILQQEIYSEYSVDYRLLIVGCERESDTDTTQCQLFLKCHNDSLNAQTLLVPFVVDLLYNKYTTNRTSGV